LQLKLKLNDDKNKQWLLESFELMKQVASGEAEEEEPEND
jgi:hypothetical protein